MATYFCDDLECWQEVPCTIHGGNEDDDDLERVLARIVRVLRLEPISNADRIELASVLGWKVIVKKEENFQVGSLAVYFAIDSMLDPTATTAFLENKPLKTRKIRGVFSQGLLAPLSWVEPYLQGSGRTIADLKEDDDVTALMKVRKYISPEERESNGPNRVRVKVPLPYQIPKTCEARGQEAVKMVRNMTDKPVVITTKYDGCSATFYLCKGEFGITGRNEVLFRRSLESDQKVDVPAGSSGMDHYFKANARYNIEEKLRALGRDLAIRGEVVGPKVSGNRLKLPAVDFFVFNIWDIALQRYLSWNEVTEITDKLGLPRVPVVFRGNFPLEWASVEALLKLAGQQVYSPKVPAEGIVVKTDHNDPLASRESFKIISNSYLTSHNL